MPIWPGCTLGNNGRARAPERFVKSVGIQTLVMKLRLVQSVPGRSFTRVDFFASPEEVWRTILRFLEKGFGTVEERYKRRELNQTFTDCREALVEVSKGNTAPATVAGGKQRFRNVFADLGGDRARYPNFGNAGRADRRRRMRSASCARQIFVVASLAGSRARKRRRFSRPPRGEAQPSGGENF